MPTTCKNLPDLCGIAKWASLTGFHLIVLTIAPSFANGQVDQAARLPVETQPSVHQASAIPERDEQTTRLAQAAWQSEVLGFEDDPNSGFARRPRATRLPQRHQNSNNKPKFGSFGGFSMIRQTTWEEPATERDNEPTRRDEYVYDGNDRGLKVKVDRSWNMIGLDTEDTVGHFDTLDGRRLVSPSNRVAIYAPRFGSVRRVDRVFNARLSQPAGTVDELTPIARSKQADFSTTNKQHIAVERHQGTRRASGFIDQTRGVLAENTTELYEFANTFAPYEHLSLIRLGRAEESQSARLALGMQSAAVWQDNMELQVFADNVQPVIVEDIAKVQELVHYETDGENSILRVVKIASKIAARAGEKVQFTIRFDNLSGKRIGNVTLIDNLTTRLEYVKGSAECSLPAKLVTSRNDVGSRTLRWEIKNPLPAGEGGIIRFECVVR
jgi:uncharacterized repeat protein (TIGR01451 family)